MPRKPRPMTEAQRLILAAVAGYTIAPTARRVADVLERPRWRARRWHRRQVDASLRRMERRGWVRSTDQHAGGLGGERWETVWSPTDVGRAIVRGEGG